MDRTEIRAVVTQVMNEIAPAIELSALRPEEPLRAQIDLDSMDWLNCVIELGRRLNLEIPENDYGRLATLEALLAYLEARLR